MQYKIVYSTTYRQWLAIEYQYSLENYGHPHAVKFFAELEKRIQQLAFHPQWFCSCALPKNTGYLFYGRSQKRGLGVYVTFLIDDEENQVRILRIYGRNLFHELKNELKEIWRQELIK